MTNKQRQASIDKQKWLDSESMGVDLSGKMVCCYHCEHQTDVGNFDTVCTIAHEQRAEKCACAKAYNRMTRAK